MPHQQRWDIPPPSPNQPRGYGEPLHESVYRALNDPPVAAERPRGFYEDPRVSPPPTHGPVTYNYYQQEFNIDPTRYMRRPGSRKSRLVALLLCMFLGVYGIHRFYVGKVGTGLLWLFTLGLFGFGWFIDLLVVALGGFRDANGDRLIEWDGSR